MIVNVISFHLGKHLLLLYFYPFQPISRGSKHEDHYVHLYILFRDVDMNSVILFFMNMGIFLQREELMDMDHLIHF